MTALASLSALYVNFRWFHDDTVSKSNRAVLSCGVSGPILGLAYTFPDGRQDKDDLRPFSPPEVAEVLRFIYKAICANKGEVDIDGAELNLYKRGILSPLFSSKKDQPRKREPSDNPVIIALMDYFDNGNETDLCAAIDMLTDAGKFDPV